MYSQLDTGAAAGTHALLSWLFGAVSVAHQTFQYQDIGNDNAVPGNKPKACSA
jgi:hypothetical protein